LQEVEPVLSAVEVELRIKKELRSTSQPGLPLGETLLKNNYQ